MITLIIGVPDMGIINGKHLVQSIGTTLFKMTNRHMPPIVGITVSIHATNNQPFVNMQSNSLEKTKLI